VTQETRFVVRYEAAELEVLVSLRYAELHLGDEWLVLPVSFSGGSASSTLVRAAISLRGPDGTRYPLPSQETFREAYREIHPSLREADVASPPPGEFGGIREPCERWFFAGPSESFAYEEIHVTPHRVCSGPLVFLVPGGVQPGRWVLEIDLAEARVRIPFVLEDGTAVR
jgi:hypothetical protein